MTDAAPAPAPAPSTSAPASSAVEAELAKFAAMADTWWDPEGLFKPLHVFNPTRLAYIRDHAAARFGRDVTGRQPFAGLRLLDIGCGGGLLCEPMARLGFEVTGIDATEKNTKIAAVHAESSGVDVTYRCATPEALLGEGKMYDVVLTMEVVEHVADVDAFLASCGALVKPGGLLIGATLNRTVKALALAKFGAEYVLRWLPKGTHDWKKFVKPSEFAAGLRAGGLTVDDLSGMTFNPLAGTWSITRDLDVNYLVAAHKAA
ncbi:bifunctional 2-polyprenyl-6-hydroxyphenol methylase/3-demethylubiquinol 3-O-methyltransferase UbiG [Roseospira marina]|uniref:Ubiquinone biosynthesis O-methyltransferase n=1 Tax=Roseospira marina TaxID=140057 RepID=A0A5M6IFU0_9PROT|nr:bifunctional 2-polyprenyl-6-hydroxyphenol methylase/3-demethylubiquinol 3-O-methyltransferase UbiG [Roseospira marina]KAA5606448.1 bifunctional 2-polyprenyl-6-hydroxyphenol methylase/3-demethylubiquinol 3-O-methyltransferase UbiG [Roseospira marina]MBB4314137.1 2-polyprenyl-6-hydroxyphenyl methylase/3-demethylubiquinone-9 3-methyltransferase [Roseospira marina]MBB5087298.1 2-polyprenyl-6-hydroxyphenyl methylase/3-demethylubiquinone-9 3-methyltransferase [Roseospira marina]